MDDYTEFLKPADLAAVKDFILAHWEDTVRVSPADEGTLLRLPHPYTVPSRKGSFQELYYWDTYFTSLGLMESGRTDLALGNARNLLDEVDRFGFVPNGNRTFYLNRSQPPYLASLVADLAAAGADDTLLPEALPLLRREYEFWITRRATPTGLARFGHHATEAELLEFHAEIAPRTGLRGPASDSLEVLPHIMAEAESGWDFNPRFDRRCDEFCAVDLNCLLYTYENLFARHDVAPGGSHWSELAALRVQRLNEFCWDEARGGFYDYDFVNGQRSGVVSAAGLLPLWAGVASEAQAAMIVRSTLPQLEFAFGVAACGVRPDNRRCQWDFPNLWPPMQHLAAKGLARYGYKEEARRVARKYLAAVCRTFQETGDLWEKYNVEDGSSDTFSEAGYPNSAFYGETTGVTAEAGTEAPPAMMGWTAGVFMTLLPWAADGD